MSVTNAKHQSVAAMRCAEILARGAKQTTREWARLAAERRETSLEAFAAFLRCRSPADLLVAQADAVSGHLDLVSQASGRLAEILAGAAGTAARALEAGGADH